ncbi:MAG TPA: ubiquinol-cytochrome C chaperone [Rhodospirillales bacterium]|nr:ubiquinol-cytochrome C chaperone [Rhodospirillales bacterium]
MARPLAEWRERRRRRRFAWRLYRQAVAQARRPEFYAVCGVPDSVEGRFELVTLHVLLLWRWLRRRAGEEEPLAQAVVDAFFTDIDRNLREMGVGDLSVGKHVKRIAGSFLARTRDLAEALDRADADAVAAILARNLEEPGRPPADAAALARYALAQDAALRGAAPPDPAEARVPFLPPRFGAGGDDARH